MSVRTFVDTNVLAYLYDAAEPRKRARAREILREEQRSGSLVVSSQVLSELYVTLTRAKKGKPAMVTAEIAERIVRTVTAWTVVAVDGPMVVDAVALHLAARVSFWDALILRAAATAGCERLLSEDLNDGQEIAGVRIENPFR